VKILLLTPAACKPAVASALERVERILKQSGHAVVMQIVNDDLYSRVMDEKPDVVFNLASIFAWEKTGHIPAILEIAGVRYTGSGFLTLSLARNPTILLPLLESSGIAVPPYRVIKAGEPVVPKTLHFPLRICRDGFQPMPGVSGMHALKNVLGALPPQEDLLLCENHKEATVSVFILDSRIFPHKLAPALQNCALSAYHLLEARGLLRFDFIQPEQPLLLNIEASPDPLGASFLEAAAAAGLDEADVIRMIVEQAGCD